jgi:hypothetical protein
MIEPLCPIHGCLVTNEEHGQRFCLRCFAEARQDTVPMSLAELLRRLGASEPIEER